jgi:hypothetical protein
MVPVTSAPQWVRFVKSPSGEDEPHRRRPLHRSVKWLRFQKPDFRGSRMKPMTQFQSAEMECTIDDLGFGRADAGQVKLRARSSAGVH